VKKEPFFADIMKAKGREKMGINPVFSNEKGLRFSAEAFQKSD